MTDTPPPIGVLGGSFDPIHVGHLRAAEEVREALALALVYFIPAANPPHKPGALVASGADRLRMVELAIAGNPAFRASSLEVDRGGLSYSVDTLQALRATVAPGTALHFIVGIDAFREIHLWRDSPRVFELANVVVIHRPPMVLDPSIAHLPVAAREAFCYDPGTQSHSHRSGNRLRFLPIPGLDVSSTQIRQHVADGRSIRYLTPPEVERCIAERGLYSRRTS